MTMTDDAPTADAAEPGGEPEKTGKKAKKGKEKAGRSNLVPALVLAAGIAVGGWFMGGSGGSSEAASTETTVEAEVVEGPLLAVEPMTVNLAGGHYLRVGVAFQMTDAYEDAVEGEEGEVFAHHHASEVTDMMIFLFGGRDAGPLTGAEGRNEVKHELHERANEIFDGAVMDVFFTEFVIQ